MGLLDSTAEEPHSKALRYVVTAVVFIALLASLAWWLLRFRTEKRTVALFLSALATGQTEEAYRIWKPAPGYSYKDFLDDWGPSSEYGPVHSFRIESAGQLKASSGVIVAAEVSPFQPFPPDDDAVKQSKTKEVKIWVEQSDQSLSFPP